MSAQGHELPERVLPRVIYESLSKRVLGQDEVLKKIAVAVYKHINSLKAGNVLLIGNSGTGKTTIMQAIQHFYREREELASFQAMVIMNANLLQGDEKSSVNLMRLFRNLETSVVKLAGPNITPDELKSLMEHATVCIDEVDKISSRISDAVSPTGIAIQQALLTLLEGETVLYNPVLISDRSEKIQIDTSHMLFVCGGAFEGLYDQVLSLIMQHKDERQLKETLRMKGGDGPQVRLLLQLEGQPEALRSVC
ncbi:MAG: AAA family ATPase, partial [Desulfovibrionales bacterium]